MSVLWRAVGAVVLAGGFVLHELNLEGTRGTKEQIPGIKAQTNPNDQCSNRLGFGLWSLEFVCDQGFDAWCFPARSGATAETPQTPLGRTTTGSAAGTSFAGGGPNRAPRRVGGINCGTADPRVFF